ncbi:hypothetical protein AYI69_g5818 [Smittium culicis]|uniref:Transcription initiation factor TFIID subunit 4 n=1 Tax=Smittium culicis TaxID=133412 RepID=A0A1R1Y365_9FUNG|nr:hypothetical protein AYI69_g5818 [Smittium culicis]
MDKKDIKEATDSIIQDEIPNIEISTTNSFKDFDSLINSIPSETTPNNIDNYDFDALFDSVGIVPSSKNDQNLTQSDNQNSLDFLNSNLLSKSSENTSKSQKTSSNNFLSDKDFNFSIEELEKIMAQANQTPNSSSTQTNQELPQMFKDLTSSVPVNSNISQINNTQQQTTEENKSSQNKDQANLLISSSEIQNQPHQNIPSAQPQLKSPSSLNIHLLSKSNSQSSLINLQNHDFSNASASSPAISPLVHNSSPLVPHTYPSNINPNPHPNHNFNLLHINNNINNSSPLLADRSSKLLKKKNLSLPKKSLGRPSTKIISSIPHRTMLNNSMNELDISLNSQAQNSIRPKSDFPNLQPNIQSNFLLPNQPQIQMFNPNPQVHNPQIALMGNSWNNAPMFRPNQPNVRPNMPIFRPDINIAQNPFPNPQMRPNILNAQTKPTPSSGVPAHTYIARLMAQLPPNKQIQLSQSLLQLQSNVISTKTFLDRATSILGPDLTTLLETLFNKPQNNSNSHGLQTNQNNVKQSKKTVSTPVSPSKLPNQSLPAGQPLLSSKNSISQVSLSLEKKKITPISSSLNTSGSLKNEFESPSSSNFHSNLSFSGQNPSESAGKMTQNASSKLNPDSIKNLQANTSNTIISDPSPVLHEPSNLLPLNSQIDLQQNLTGSNNSSTFNPSLSHSNTSQSISNSISESHYNQNQNQNLAPSKNDQTFNSENSIALSNSSNTSFLGSSVDNQLRQNAIAANDKPALLNSAKSPGSNQPKVNPSNPRSHLSTLERLELIIKDGILSLEALKALSQYLTHHGEEIANSKDPNKDPLSPDQIKINLIRIQNLQANISLRQKKLQQNPSNPNQQSKPLLNIPSTQALTPKENIKAPIPEPSSASNNDSLISKFISQFPKDKKLSKYKLNKLAKSGGDISSLLMHYNNFNQKNKKVKATKKSLKNNISGNQLLELQKLSQNLRDGAIGNSPFLNSNQSNLSDSTSNELDAKKASLASLNELLNLNDASNKNNESLNSSSFGSLLQHNTTQSDLTNKRLFKNSNSAADKESLDGKSTHKKQKNSIAYGAGTGQGGIKESGKQPLGVNSNASHDPGPLSTGIDDVMGIAGVDLRKERENILHASLIQNQRKYKNDGASDSYYSESEQPKTYSVILNNVEIVKESRKKLEFLNEAKLDDKVSLLLNNNGIKKVSATVTEILSQAVEYRLRSLVKSMISAAYHRMRTQTIPPPPLNQTTNTPLYRIVPSFDLRKQLSALERVDKNNERKFFESLLDPDSLKSVSGLGSVTSNRATSVNKPIANENEIDSVEDFEVSNKNDAMTGKLVTKNKRKRVSNSGLDKSGLAGSSSLSLAYAAVSGSGGSGSMLSARNMPDEVRSKITNQTALMSAGGVRKSWMMSSHLNSEWKTPTPNNSSFLSNSSSHFIPPSLKHKKSKVKPEKGPEEPRVAKKQLAPSSSTLSDATSPLNAESKNVISKKNNLDDIINESNGATVEPKVSESPITNDATDTNIPGHSNQNLLKGEFSETTAFEKESGTISNNEDDTFENNEKNEGSKWSENNFKDQGSKSIKANHKLGIGKIGLPTAKKMGRVISRVPSRTVSVSNRNSKLSGGFLGGAPLHSSTIRKIPVVVTLRDCLFCLEQERELSSKQVGGQPSAGMNYNVLGLVGTRSSVGINVLIKAYTNYLKD